MEAALRGISLCLTMDLLWPFSEEEKPWLDQMTASLWQHFRFIEAHSEFSFLSAQQSLPEQHCRLDDPVCVSSRPRERRRLRKYARAVQREILLQTYADGGDREASTGYHVLVAQMGLHSLHGAATKRMHDRTGIRGSVAADVRVDAALADDAGKLPHLGDCDNGRVELLSEDIAQATQPACQRHSLRTGSLYALASHLLQLPAGAGERARSRSRCCLTPGLPCSAQGTLQWCFPRCRMDFEEREATLIATNCPLSCALEWTRFSAIAAAGATRVRRTGEILIAPRRAHNTLMIDGADQNTISSDPQMLFQCGNEAAVSRYHDHGRR